MNNSVKDIKEPKWYAFMPIRNILIGGVLAVIIYFASNPFHIPVSLINGLYILIIVVSSFYWAKEALSALIKKHLVGTGILVIAAIISSAVLGLWNEAIFLALLYGAAEGIENYTFARTRHSIKSLLNLTPKEALVIVNGKEKLVPAEDLSVGDVFIVKPGGSVPTDGIIVSGKAHMDESAITGEPIPVLKDYGDHVFAGTIVLDGSLNVRAVSVFENNTVSKIIKLVESAQESKSRIQLTVERFGNVYSPIVLVVALLLMIIPRMAGLQNSLWDVRAISFLVAAAPCALIISTPVTVTAAINRASKRGILIKGGVFIESLGLAKAVLLDKTGTLTFGNMTVTSFFFFGIEDSELFSILYSIEKLSDHPIARAITEYIKDKEHIRLSVSDFVVLPGIGIKARIKNALVYVGKPLSISDKKVVRNTIGSIGEQTVIVVKKNEKLVGILTLSDKIRPEIKIVLEEICKKGLHLAMLTGDNKQSAEKIAKELGILDIKYNLKPADKFDIVKEYKRKYGIIVMIGDGINDAPALAAADIGIAMGAVGTDVAMEAADIIFMSDRLDNFTYLLGLSKRTKKINKQNIIFSSFVLSVLIPLSLLGLAHVTVAVIIHEASELIAVLNGLRAGFK